MKWIILFALTFGCTTKSKDKVKTPTYGPESEGTQVSPYTVQPCYCMKIFRPVCAGGINYGNSCEAECDGHKSWTEGHCGEGKRK